MPLVNGGKMSRVEGNVHFTLAELIRMTEGVMRETVSRNLTGHPYALAEQRYTLHAISRGPSGDHIVVRVEGETEHPLGWSHVQHTDDCMSDWSEARRDGMTRATIAANHRLHMADVERAEDPTDGVTE